MGAFFRTWDSFFRLYADGILCPRAIRTRAPDFSVSFLHFVLPDTGKGTGGGLGAQIKRQYRGKIRIKPPYTYTSIWGVPAPGLPYA